MEAFIIVKYTSQNFLFSTLLSAQSCGTFTCCVTTFTACYQKLCITLSGNSARLTQSPPTGPPLQALAPTPEAPGYAGVPGFLQACGWGCPAPGHWSVLRDLSLKQRLCPSPPQTDSVSSPKWGVLYLGSTPHPTGLCAGNPVSPLWFYLFFLRLKKNVDHIFKSLY